MSPGHLPVAPAEALEGLKPPAAGLAAWTATPLSLSLGHLKSVARARVSGVGIDVKDVVIELRAGIGAHARTAVGHALHGHAFGVVGAAVVAGVLAGLVAGAFARPLRQR